MTAEQYEALIGLIEAHAEYVHSKYNYTSAPSKQYRDMLAYNKANEIAKAALITK
jgi:hypothetical protein